MPKTQQEHRSSAREPWLLFSNAEGLEPHQIMALYSRRMQIEQNFRDDKSPRFGLKAEPREPGERAAGSAGSGRGDGKSGAVAGRLQGRKAVFTLALSGKQYQAQAGAVLPGLAEEVLRHEPGKVRRLNIGNEMKKLGKEYSNMVMEA